VKELFELMMGYGYRAYDVGSRRRVFRHELSLRPIAAAAAADESMDTNVAWVIPGTIHEGRLAKYVRA